MNPIYIGQTAYKAAQSHGSANDGRLRSCGGPQHPSAGCLEEPNTPQAARLAGVVKLGQQYAAKLDGDGDYDGGAKMNESI